MTDNNNKASFLPSIEVEKPKRTWSELAEELRPRSLPDEDIGAYCFSLHTGRVVFGVWLGERDDSFLVALPALLYGGQDGISAKPWVTEHVVRLMKSSVSLVAGAPEAQIYFYYKYLLKKQDTSEEYFTDHRLALLEAMTEKMPEDSARAEAMAVNDPRGESSQDDDDDIGASNPDAWKRMPYTKNTRH